MTRWRVCMPARCLQTEPCRCCISPSGGANWLRWNAAWLRSHTHRRVHGCQRHAQCRCLAGIGAPLCRPDGGGCDWRKTDRDGGEGGRRGELAKASTGVMNRRSSGWMANSTRWSVRAGNSLPPAQRCASSVPGDTIIEDFYLSLRIAQRGYRVAYAPDAYARTRAFRLHRRGMETQSADCRRRPAGNLPAAWIVQSVPARVVDVSVCLPPGAAVDAGAAVLAGAFCDQLRAWPGVAACSIGCCLAHRCSFMVRQRAVLAQTELAFASNCFIFHSTSA